MATIDRLKGEIQLFSPRSDGEKPYSGKWIGNPISKEKKLGVFSSPKVKGSIVQDLDVKGDIVPLTIYFDGEDNDLISNNFWKSLDANGTWRVIHPLLGEKTLQLSSATWEVQPVKSIDYTRFQTSWIEPTADGVFKSVPELVSTLNSYIAEADISAGRQYRRFVKLNLFDEFSSLVSAVNKIVNTVRASLRKFENLQLIDPRFEALISGIGTTLESFPPDMEALTTQIQGLFETVSLAQNSAIGAVDNLISFSNDLLAQSFDNGLPTNQNLNSLLSLELALSSVNVSVSRAVLLPGIETRGQAIEFATKINDSFNFMINNLEESQALFKDSPIEDQYVAQSESFADQLKANKQSILYLLNTITSLKVERVFTTKVPRAPLEIAWTELGGPGEIIEEDGMRIDKNYADFCRWNDLHGQDLIILPAGTQVRIFV